MPAEEIFETLSQLENGLIKGNGMNIKLRSQKFDFGLFIQHCRMQQNSILFTYRILTSDGRKKSVCRQAPLPDRNEDDSFSHRHDFFELLYIAEGNLNIIIESALYQYRKGDFCIVNCNVVHRELYDCDNTVIYFSISRELARELAGVLADCHAGKDIIHLFKNPYGNPHGKHFIEFRRNMSAEENGSVLIENLLREMTGQSPAFFLIVRALLIRIFCILSDPEQYLSNPHAVKFTRKEKLFDQIREYILDHDGIIPRSEFEEHLHYGADYLNRITRQHTGMSLTEYTQQCHILRAACLIRNTDMSIAEICRETGFDNKVYFYRLFKKICRMTPTEYRRAGGRSYHTGDEYK